jgi:hypothetical protein
MGTAGGGVSMVQAAIVKTVRLVSAADQRQLVPFLGYPPINLKECPTPFSDEIATDRHTDRRRGTSGPPCPVTVRDNQALWAIDLNIHRIILICLRPGDTVVT